MEAKSGAFTEVLHHLLPPMIFQILSYIDQSGRLTASGPPSAEHLKPANGPNRKSLIQVTRVKIPG
jgi:hypothetical protein